jgi:hypothetical protein
MLGWVVFTSFRMSVTFFSESQTLLMMRSRIGADKTENSSAANSNVWSVMGSVGEGNWAL